MNKREWKGQANQTQSSRERENKVKRKRQGSNPPEIPPIRQKHSRNKAVTDTRDLTDDIKKKEKITYLE